MPQSAGRASKSASSSAGSRSRAASRSPLEIARGAVEQFTEIMGAKSETISGMQRTDDGWLIHVEVVELERIPESTNVMATYEVEVDGGGALSSYRRIGRYYRNQAGDS